MKTSSICPEYFWTLHWSHWQSCFSHTTSFHHLCPSQFSSSNSKFQIYLSKLFPSIFEVYLATFFWNQLPLTCSILFTNYFSIGRLSSGPIQFEIYSSLSGCLLRFGDLSPLHLNTALMRIFEFLFSNLNYNKIYFSF